MSTKKVTVFYLEGCPYCKQAREALNELANEKPEYSSVNIEWVEESRNPDIVNQYDYYYVPAMFVDGVKAYESHRGEKYGDCKENVRKVLEKALA